MKWPRFKNMFTDKLGSYNLWFPTNKTSQSKLKSKGTLLRYSLFHQYVCEYVSEEFCK